MSDNEALHSNLGLPASTTAGISITIGVISLIAVATASLVVIETFAHGFKDNMALLLSGIMLPLSSGVVFRKYREWGRMIDPSQQSASKPFLIALVNVVLVLSIVCMMLALPRIFDKVLR